MAVGVERRKHRASSLGTSWTFRLSAWETLEIETALIGKGNLKRFACTSKVSLWAGMSILNKKILCFVDECGTAGNGELHMGAVFIFARNAGRTDKLFTNLLEPNANEIHAVKLTDSYTMSLLTRFNDAVPDTGVLMLNRRASINHGDARTMYGQAVVETVKMGLTRFRRQMPQFDHVRNVDLIIDVNSLNSSPKFDEELQRARSEKGQFQAVQNVAKIDSSAVRLLQLADVVAYTRRWVARGVVTPETLRTRYRITML